MQNLLTKTEKASEPLRSELQRTNAWKLQPSVALVQPGYDLDHTGA